MADESTPCNPEQVNTAFVQAPKAINTIIANKSRVYHAIYRDLIPRDTFAMGEGYMKFSETFHGGLALQDAAASWSQMEPFRAPATLSPEDPGYDPCLSSAAVISYGIEEKKYTVYQAERRTLDICLTDIMFDWQFEKQLALIYQSLTNVTLGEWEQITREAYITISQKFFCQTTTPDLVGTGLAPLTITPATGASFGGSIAVPVGGLGVIGRLTTAVLDRLYQYLSRQAAGGALSMQDGMPIFGLISSMETIRELISLDPKEIEASKWAQPEINIEGYGKLRVYKNFAQIADPQTPRFKVDATGANLIRVFPYVTPPTTIGQAINVNPDYINAPFELSVIFLKDVYTAQVPPPNPASLAGGYKFDPYNNFGDFEWMNIQERCTNPRREKGFFLARYRMTPEPGMFSTDAISILSRRCNILKLEECTHCVDGKSTGVTITACAQYDVTQAAAAAVKYILTLSECLNAQIGDQVTITYGGGTTTGILADNFAGTEVVVDFASATGAGWCAASLTSIALSSTNDPAQTLPEDQPNYQAKAPKMGAKAPSKAEGIAKIVSGVAGAVAALMLAFMPMKADAQLSPTTPGVYTNMPAGATWTGTRLGQNSMISNGVAGGIAIGDGVGGTNDMATVSANGAAQIGRGNNTTANTLMFRGNFVLLNPTNSSGTAFVDPSQLTAGGSISAVNLAAATNLPVATGLAAGGTMPAENGAALTALTAANITAGSLASTMTIGGLSPVVNDLSGQRMIQYGVTGTNGVTVTFNTAFHGGVVPVVILCATNACTIVPYVTGVASNSFVYHGDNDTTIKSYIAIGQK